MASHPGMNRGVASQAPIRLIKDPIHDYIPVNQLLSRFIDTKQFQRLRNVKQLGTTSYVWPSASHTRFEHSLGVAHLARIMATHLQSSQPELNITNRDVSCVEIAGLCHDLGHGPWSHVWDGLFIPVALPGCDWTHEKGSEMMFNDLITENNISELTTEDQEFIKALIAGDPTRCSTDEKPFLFDIVANKRNGLDVDKFDYIHRDTNAVGDPIHLSLDRLVNSARVLDNQICYDIKDANHLYEICNTRFKLHKNLYNHKTAKAIEYMIIDGLLAAEPYMNIAERIKDPKRYLHLTDNIMLTIEASENPELQAARDIFGKIRERHLYKMVDYKVVDWPLIKTFKKNITSKTIVEAAKPHIKEASTPDLEGIDASSTASSSEELQESDVIVDFSIMHFGMKEKNPLDSVRFYSKRNPNICQKAERGDYSNLMPAYFGECLLRVYTKKPNLVALVQTGYRAALADLSQKADLSDPTLQIPHLELEPGAPTPPATEPPTTPRNLSHSRNASFSFQGSGSTPFSNNTFTTVPQPPPSPSRPSGRKRGREASPEKGVADTPRPKKPRS